LRFLRFAARECQEHESGQGPHGLTAEARERIKQKLQAGCD
jgi:hypothetical protein